MTKEPYKLYVRVPVFGDGLIRLYDESKIVHNNKFRDEINRLREIPHLGILHYFSGIPKYSRYDHVMLMLLLIQQISDNKSTDLNLKNRLKIDKVEFSSIEEFLKSLSMLYSIGHLQMTFTSEYTLLRFLTKNNKVDEFIGIISNKIKDVYGEDDEFGNKMIENFKNIVETGKLYEFSKIFTALKILNNIENENDENFKKILIVLLNIFILRDSYIEGITKNSPRQNEKLKKTMDYFETVRELAFLILDGAISQHVLNLSPYSVVIHLDKFVSENPYKHLLNDVRKFYDDTIYMSDEGQYYHYRISSKIEKNVFEKEKSLTDIISKIINNNYDGDIKDTIKKEEIKEIDKDRSEGKIIKILKRHIKIIIPPILHVNGVKADNKCFNGLKYHYGGVSHYKAPNGIIRKYRIDIYPKNCDNQLPLEYDNEIWKIADSLYNILKDNNEMIFKEKGGFSPFSVLRRIEFFNIFNPIAKYLASNYLSTNAEFPSYKLKNRFAFNNKHVIKFPILFKSEHINYVIKIMEECKDELDNEGGDNGDINEMNQIINILKKDIAKENNGYYILSPQVNLIRDNNEKSELDFLLIEYECSNNGVKSIKIKIGETKSDKKRHNTKQLTNQLRLSFGIDKDTANLISRKEMSGCVNIRCIDNKGKSRIFIKEIHIDD